MGLQLLKVLVIFVKLSQVISSEGNDKALETGKNRFEIIQRSSKMPRFGDCWKQSLLVLENGCKELTDDRQSRMALQFANCFLAQSGQKIYPCEETNSVSDCLTLIDSNGFTAYSEFFTHTHNMCQFLQQQIWHENTEQAISGLTKTSSQVAESLENSSKLQEDIVKNQMETLDYQKKIAEYGTILSQSVEQSKLHVRELMNELKHSTNEQKTMIFSIFDRVTKLQTLLLSEVSWLYTVLFYSGCLLAVYLATATKRTEDARLWLFAILSLNFIVERIICSWTLGSDEANIFEVYINEEQNPQAILYFRIWMSRKLSILAACLVLLVKALTFKDYNVINYELLQDIRKQNADLCQSVQFLKSFNTTNRSNDVIDEGVKNILENHFADNEDSEEEDNLSFDSNITDATWKVDLSDFEDEMENEDFESLDTTPTNNNDISEIVPIVNNISGVSFDEVTSNSKPQISRKRGRPPGSRSSSRGGTPSPVVHNYSFRQRKPNQTFNGFDHGNPILDEESPDTFGKVVASLARQAKSTRKRLISMSLTSTHENFLRNCEQQTKLNILSDNDE